MRLNPGDTIYFFDPNQRRYQRVRGRASGAPVYRAHFRPVQIAEVRARSYGLTDGCWIGGRTITTLPKDQAKWPAARPGAISGFFVVDRETVDELCWLDANRLAIADAVRACEVAAVLKTIGRIIGVDEVKEVPPEEWQ